MYVYIHILYIYNIHLWYIYITYKAQACIIYLYVHVWAFTDIRYICFTGMFQGLLWVYIYILYIYISIHLFKHVCHGALMFTYPCDIRYPCVTFLPLPLRHFCPRHFPLSRPLPLLLTFSFTLPFSLPFSLPLPLVSFPLSWSRYFSRCLSRSLSHYPPHSWRCAKNVSSHHTHMTGNREDLS